jgi:hypothetical protein
MKTSEPIIYKDNFFPKRSLYAFLFIFVFSILCFYPLYSKYGIYSFKTISGLMLIFILAILIIDGLFFANVILTTKKIYITHLVKSGNKSIPLDKIQKIEVATFFFKYIDALTDSKAIGFYQDENKFNSYVLSPKLIKQLLHHIKELTDKDPSLHEIPVEWH